MDVFDLAAIGAGLPVAADIDRLPVDGAVVVQAPPGTGKTTLVPPAVANQLARAASEGTAPGKVIVTAPRRVAVRAAARRLADLDGSRLGDKVGYAVRGDARPGSAVEFVTPGVLLRRLLSDPELTGVGAIIIDEIHERQLDTDVVVGMAVELAQLRDDLRIIAMSATLNASMLADFLNAQVLSTPDVTYPLDISYHPHAGRIGGEREFYSHLAQLATTACKESGHSVIVFVPGQREVRMVCAEIPGALPLHGQLSSQEQDAALTVSTVPRIVVSTAVAESSLTVPGVRVVVDSGLSRVPRRDVQRDMNGLVTVTAAQSTMEQRAGRAGREGPGRVLRAYSPSDFQHAPTHITPEIATSDLTSARLTVAAWGGGSDFPFLDAPPAQAWAQAEETLQALGALDSQGHITALGESIARLPMYPRLARALLLCGKTSAATIAVLSDSPSGNIARSNAPVKERLRLEKLAVQEENAHFELPHRFRGIADPGVITALAYPQRIARKVADSTYLLASGSRAWLPPEMGLQDAHWLAIAEVSVTAGSSVTLQHGRRTSGAGVSGAIIRAAAPIAEAAALDILDVKETLRARVVDGTVQGRKIKTAGAIELSSTPVSVSPADAADAIREELRHNGLGMLVFSDKALCLKERMDFLHAQLGDPWPDISDTSSVDPSLWLDQEIATLAHGTRPENVDMFAALQKALPWPAAASLSDLAPECLEVPSGSHPRIDYSSGRPVVRVKLQECFGLAESPEIAGIRVQFHLLSPAGRPLAVTDDLASFWSGPYAGVRAEMRGRYPKHPWPEDPWSATATAKTKRGMQK
ncbi:MAG: ATP-dependent helicase HrpB [Corynebacterium sp.]|nr:ATP-dependent helicase HrpB [Corynebacterium sp.]